MYLFNKTTGTVSYTLTGGFKGAKQARIYTMSDTGTSLYATIPVVNGKITAKVNANTPYVVTTSGSIATPAANWGQDSGINDPGFNSGNLTAWDAKNATIVTLPTGDPVAQLGTQTSSISQKLTGLTPGAKYSIAANVQIQPGNKRATTLSARGIGVDASKTVSLSPAINWVAADAKHTTDTLPSTYQRLPLYFVAPKDGIVTVSLDAVAGAATVQADDFQLMEITAPPGINDPAVPTTLGDPLPVGVIEQADFEDNQPGWGPFVKGDAGGVTDPRTHIAKRHAPFTSKGFNGNPIDRTLTGLHSLMAHSENTGLVYRTTTNTVDFQPHHKYRVEFNYQNASAHKYSWVTGYDQNLAGSTSNIESALEPLPVAATTTKYNHEFVAGCGADWVGLRAGGGDGDFILDDFKVTDLGKQTEAPACAMLTAPAKTVRAGGASQLVTTFTNHGSEPATDVSLTAAAPAGWTITATANGTAATVAPGATLATTWSVAAPLADANLTKSVGFTANYDSGTPHSVTADSAVRVSEADLIDPASLTVTTDSQQADAGIEGPAAFVLDDNPDTIWHSEYSPQTTAFPHWLAFDAGTARTLSGLSYLARQDGGDNGRIKDYQIFISDTLDVWPTTPVKTGTFLTEGPEQKVTFAATKGRYLKLVAINSHNGQPFAAAAEVRLFGL